MAQGKILPENYSFSDICHLGKLLLMGGSSQSRLGTFSQHISRVLIYTILSSLCISVSLLTNISMFVDLTLRMKNLNYAKIFLCFIAYLPHVRSTYAVATTIIAVMHYLLSYLQYDRY